MNVLNDDERVNIMSDLVDDKFLMFLFFMFFAVVGYAVFHFL